ncbi:MAG: hypothetical protein ABI925_01730 [Verrucomicrobiota bacterium]
MKFERRIEGAAFIAALSRFLSSPEGLGYASEKIPVEVRAYAVPASDAMELYLSESAFKAATAAFSPLPVSETRSVDTLPDGCEVIIQGSQLPWGLADAQDHLTSHVIRT